jgi:Cytochrome b5-like Heme/Steroid binding domain
MNIDPKHQPKPFKKRRYYIPEEVEFHNTAFNCWVSFFNEVYDISSLLQSHQGIIHLGDALCHPLIKVAGSDISYWFNKETGDPRTFIDPVSNLETVYCPWGEYLHINKSLPTGTVPALPWWKDKEKYLIGKLTKKTRKIRIINMLTKEEECIKVASEETLYEILDRLLDINTHSGSYTWKRQGRPLDMELTLEENGIPDESSEFLKYNLDDDFYIPALHLYYNDDLT